MNVRNLLEDDGWSIINNRYYIDESTNTQREIDIIAYKTISYDDIRFFYVLLISCKKSEERDWVLISRPLKEKDVNFQFYPQLIWNNSDILKLTKQEEKLNSSIEEQCKNKHTDFSKIYGLRNRVYAFQEVGSNSDKPQNDKSIFSSIDSLIKSAHFEFKSLKKRRNDDVFYHFNLMNIFDGNMYESVNISTRIEIKKIESANYINRYIVGDEDKFYRIGFFTKNLFVKKLVEINNIFAFESNEIKKSIEEFKSNFVSNWEYKSAFNKDLFNYIGSYIRNFVTDSAMYWNKIESLYISTNSNGDGIVIEVDLPEDHIEAINSQKFVMEIVKKYFKRKCKYEGPIIFGEITYPDDIPF